LLIKIYLSCGKKNKIFKIFSKVFSKVADKIDVKR